MNDQFTNELINSSSPYLLQHAHNPVNWQPWSDKAIEQAKKENKLLLVSIGYAACHWCHVMEHESFEDVEVARIMNENFVCIKVDREERPDVDQYYMTAVQLMQQRGGWPLNVIALPDGRPIWGGTYFSKEIWIKNLLNISEYYSKNKLETEEYAARLQEGITQTSLVEKVEHEIPINENILENGVNAWKEKFDMIDGGRIGAPKFPMPVNLDFLMYYGFMKKDRETLDFVKTTLEKMAWGGIYDQAGGGFARYSVDGKWKVPHFEKMLYDNGQLLSIYSKGYLLFKNEEFKTVVFETVDFLERELMDKTGAFYSSLDADSEGEEGKFYVWTEVELKNLLKDEFEMFADYFNVNSRGYWEHDNYILLRDESDVKFAAKHNLTINQLTTKTRNWKSILMDERDKRIRPGLDDKTLTSWNAIVITGLVDAYKSFREEKFLALALKNANFIQENIMQENGKLFHNWKKGKASIDGFLEDYALLIQAFISLFEISGDENWLAKAQTLADYTIEHFYDENSGLFYFSEKNIESVISNHFQKEDNVVPAANSVMANNLHLLFLLLTKTEYNEMAEQMVQHVLPGFASFPMAYANWGNLILRKTAPFFEVVVVGESAPGFLIELQSVYQPNIIWAFTKSKSNLPIFKDRLVNDKTYIYVCQEGECKLPVTTVKLAMNYLR